MKIYYYMINGKSRHLSRYLTLQITNMPISHECKNSFNYDHSSYRSTGELALRDAICSKLHKKLFYVCSRLGLIQILIQILTANQAM